MSVCLINAGLVLILVGLVAAIIRRWLALRRPVVLAIRLLVAAGAALVLSGFILEVSAPFRSGLVGPWLVAVHPSGDRIYVAGYNMAPHLNTIAVHDATHTKIATIRVPFWVLRLVVADSRDYLIAFGNEIGADRITDVSMVAIVDLKSDSVIETIKVQSGRDPQRPGVPQRFRAAETRSAPAPVEITVTTTGAVGDRPLAAFYPGDHVKNMVAEAPGGRVYFTNPGNGFVFTKDGATNRVAAVIGPCPRWLPLVWGPRLVPGLVTSGDTLIRVSSQRFGFVHWRAQALWHRHNGRSHDA